MKFKEMKRRVNTDPKVFLGGTCNDSTWRKELISMLEIDYFDPVVDDWNEEAYQRELEERKNADHVLYVITPKMTGVYSIAEAVDDSNKHPEKTLFAVLEKDGDDEFSDGQMKSLKATSKMIEENGAKIFDSLEEVATHLNEQSE
jgi:hypothetical protein